jgi:L-asparagine transporter-like permease
VKRTPPLDHHQLSARQLEFIALGAAVGSGLFIGVGQGIRIAGPGILVAYLIAGLMVFIVARCLGEMALADAPPKVFTTYTERYVGPRSAFVQGWSYWIICVLVCTADLTAAGLFVRLWLPKLPLWIPELAGLTLVFAVNRLRVRVFGEVEFWISLLKIVGIGAFLLLSVALLMSPTPRLPGSSISNLWTQGGFLPKGLLGVVAALPVALFAFGGSELIGIAAAEAERPERSLPRATNGLLFRLALFYMGTTLALVCLEAWRDVPVDSSPIVDVLRRTGVPAAATMMNAILVSAVLSSCNSTLYAGARVLRVLGEGGAAPKRLSKLNANGVPALASGVTLGAVATAILLGRFLPNGLFGLLMAMAAVIVIANWTLFLVAHLRFQRLRKAEGERRFAAPGAPWSTVAVLVLIVGTMIVALGDSGLRLGALLATGVLLSLAMVATLRTPRTSAAGAADVDGVTLPTSRGGRRHDRHGR